MKKIKTEIAPERDSKLPSLGYAPVKMTQGQLECLVDIIDIATEGTPWDEQATLKDAQYKVLISHKFGYDTKFNRIELERIQHVVSEFIDQREEDQDHNYSSWEIVLQVHQLILDALKQKQTERTICT
jgi:hypothetical protein|tara:strand:+ start:3633 stop:4016 length:384 start_codon:yes stop_codon:yes gene_type:complete